MEPDRTTDWAAQKAELEVRKLEAEIASLKKPWHRTPAAWISMATAVVSLCLLVYQIKLGEIDRRQALLDQRELNDSLRLMRKAKLALEDSTKQVRAKAEQFGVLLETNTQRVLDRAEKAVQDTTLSELRRSLITLRDSAVTGKNAPLAYAVIASFETPERALRGADEARARNLAFPVSVFRRSENRIALTLGGGTSGDSALQCVRYARRNGYSDAYVRLAGDWQRIE